VNAELTASLRRCYALVEDCRAHLAPANSNDPEPPHLGEAENETAWTPTMIVPGLDAERAAADQATSEEARRADLAFADHYFGLLAAAGHAPMAGGGSEAAPPATN
jgi:hypothetical protein